MTEAFQFHHVGWAVSAPADAEGALRAVGYQPSPTLADATDPGFGVNLRFLEAPGGSPRVELVSPSSPRSAVRAILEKGGAGPYHLAYTVPDLAEGAESMRRAGYRPAGARHSAPAFGGSAIQFFHHPALGLVELIEAKP